MTFLSVASCGANMSACVRAGAERAHKSKTQSKKAFQRTLSPQCVIFSHKIHTRERKKTVNEKGYSIESTETEKRRASSANETLTKSIAAPQCVCTRWRCSFAFHERCPPARFRTPRFWSSHHTPLVKNGRCGLSPGPLPLREIAAHCGKTLTRSKFSAVGSDCKKLHLQLCFILWREGLLALSVHQYGRGSAVDTQQHNT